MDIIAKWLGALRGLCLFAVLALLGGAAPGAPRPGDLLVLDSYNPESFPYGALFVVDAKTGRRTLLSDFGDFRQGPLGFIPISVAIGDSGRIYVSDLAVGGGPNFGGAVFEVDAETGRRKLIANFGEGDVQDSLYYGLAIGTRGRLLANLNTHAVVRIDPRGGAPTVITELANTAQGAGGLELFITELVTESARTLLIAAGMRFGGLGGGIYRVDQASGVRTLLSDFNDSSQGADAVSLGSVTGLAIEDAGSILLNSGGDTFAPRSLLLRIDANTGRRTVLSDFDNAAQGPAGSSLHGLAVERSGSIVVGGYNAATGITSALFRVHPKTGRRTILSDSADPSQGPALSLGLVDIAVVPPNRE